MKIWMTELRVTVQLQLNCTRSAKFTVHYSFQCIHTALAVLQRVGLLVMNC